MYSRWVIEDLATGDEINTHGPWSEDLCRELAAKCRGSYRLMRVDVVEEWHEVAV